MQPQEHRVLKLWIRPEEGGQMVPVDSLELEEGNGVVGDHTYGGPRHLTIVFQDDWDRAARELGAAVDPVGRRANVLVSGGGGEHLPGSRIRLGQVSLDVQGITKPCSVMDEFHPGLKEALAPEGRAGVWGRVHRGGTISLGDRLERLPSEAAPTENAPETDPGTGPEIAS
jgi:MOSC domain-containing protein YiiM